MELKANPISGVMQFNINATLKSIGTQVRELNNDKKTKYRLATAEVLVKGQKRLVTAQIWEKSASDFQVGEQYSATGSIMENGTILFQLSPFASGEKLSVADFGIAQPAAAGAKV